MINMYDSDERGPYQYEKDEEQRFSEAEKEADVKAIGCLVIGLGGVALILWGIYSIFFY